MTGDCVAQRALSVVGVPFRMHGRDPDSGLDCIGLAAHALALRLPVPTGYRLSGTAAPWRAWFAAHGFVPVKEPYLRPGDLWLVQPGPRQHHALIAVDGGFVHAHAGLGRVVLLPSPCNWPVTAMLRAPWLD